MRDDFVTAQVNPPEPSRPLHYVPDGGQEFLRQIDLVDICGIVEKPRVHGAQLGVIFDHPYARSRRPGPRTWVRLRYTSTGWKSSSYAAPAAVNTSKRFWLVNAYA